MEPFLREGSESPSAYHRYPWLMAGMSGRRCKSCTLPSLPLSHKGVEAASLILSKCEVPSIEGFATMSFLSQSGLVFMVLPSLCAQSTAGKPWMASCGGFYRQAASHSPAWGFHHLGFKYITHRFCLLSISYLQNCWKPSFPSPFQVLWV